MNKIKILVMLVANNLKVDESFEDEISYEEYSVIRDSNVFQTKRFSKNEKFENLYVIISRYNLDLKKLVLTVSKDKTYGDL